MTGFLEGQVLPELSRLEKAVKKRDNWALVVAQNDVQEQRVREESNIMMRRMEQEMADTDASARDTDRFPVETIERIAAEVGPKLQLDILKRLITA